MNMSRFVLLIKLALSHLGQIWFWRHIRTVDLRSTILASTYLFELISDRCIRNLLSESLEITLMSCHIKRRFQWFLNLWQLLLNPQHFLLFSIRVIKWQYCMWIWALILHLLLPLWHLAEIYILIFCFAFLLFHFIL